MKRLVMGIVIVAFLATFGSLAGTASADCPDFHCTCYTKDKKEVGKVTVGRCWKWWPPGCYFCHGGDNAPNKVCNKKYKECENKCDVGYSCW